MKYERTTIDKKVMAFEKLQKNTTDLKVPPQNIEAEESILGGILLDNDTINTVLEVLTPDDFYRGANRKIFEAMLQMSEQTAPIDLLTLTDYLKQNNLLEEVGGHIYLAKLVDSVATAANISYYANIVHDKAVARKIINAATEIASKGYEGGGEIDNFIDYSEKLIFSITQDKIRSAFKPVSEIIKTSFKNIEKRCESGKTLTGVATGFYDLDRMTNGLQPSDLIIIAGRPSMGKTALCLNIAQHAATKENTPVAIFSMEMSSEQLVTRLLCSEARVDSSKLRSGSLDESDWSKITMAAGHLSETSIYIDDSPSLTSWEIRSRARRLKMEKNIGLIMIDYLQLMRGGLTRSNDSREREISEISRALKALAKELDIPVLALSQLNRAVESRHDKRPMLADLRESGAIEQDADVIGFIYRDEIYNKETEEKGIAELIIGKQRNGPTGIFKLAFIDKHTKFENLAYTTDTGAPN